jgi:hypothetical protein
MCSNLTYDPEPGDAEVRYNIYYKQLIPARVLSDFFTLVIELFIISQPDSPLCEYNVWIDNVIGLEVISYLCSMFRLNMMEDEFHARRIEECTHATYFAMCYKMNREQEKEKREEERAQKCMKARHVKEAFARGGDKALIKEK